MPVKQSTYGPTAIAFHWVVVGLILVQFLLGWLMPDIHRGMTPGEAMMFHVSFGFTIMMVIVARFAWRLLHPVASEPSLPRWQRLAAETVHWLLYAVVFATTLTGWLFESARGWTIYYFGLVPLPRLVEEGSAYGRAIGRNHETLTWVLLVLVAGHVAAALVHYFFNKDRVLQRMLPLAP
jgi:cytochrome b561